MLFRLQHDDLVDWQAFLGDQPDTRRRDVDQDALQIHFPIALQGHFGGRLDPKTGFTPKIHWDINRHLRRTLVSIRRELNDVPSGGQGRWSSYHTKARLITAGRPRGGFVSSGRIALVS